MLLNVAKVLCIHGDFSDRKKRNATKTDRMLHFFITYLYKYLLTHKKYRRITVIPIDQRIVYKAVILVKQIIVLAAVVM